MSFIRIVHNDFELKTVGDFLTNRSVSLLKNITAKDFLEYNGVNSEEEINSSESETSPTNFDLIKEKYSSAEQIKINNERFQEENFDLIELLAGTELKLPIRNIEREVFFRLDTNVISSSSKAFLSKRLEDLLKDPNYSQTYDLGQFGETIIHNSDITVWMWIRSLSPDDGDKAMGKWFNASPFVKSMQTSVNKDLGQFSLDMAPVIGISDDNNGWIIDPSSIDNYDENKIKNNFTARSSIRRKIDGDYKDNQYFFQQAVQENDLVYLRFETLASEKTINSFVQNKDFEPSKIAAGNIYDMIGLVDRNLLTSNFDNNDLSIRIEGRDLMKIFIEDGSYFFPSQFAQNIFAQNNSRIIRQRSLVDGSLLTLSVYLERSILFSLQFIISQLSTTNLVPDDVFKNIGYDSESLNKVFTIQGSLQADQGENRDVSLAGVWQIIDLLVDPSVAHRRIVDASISQEQGSMINSINKLCQDPFVEFFGDTYGNKYVFQARKPPFDDIAYKGLVYDDVQTKQDAAHVVNIPEEDQFVQNVSDNGLSIDLGSVEISAPPLRPNEIDKLSDLTRDIRPSDVLDENLFYHNEAYSWYMIKPSALLYGDASDLILAYLPAISFDEYAEVFGSRTYSKETNYIPFRSIKDSQETERDNYLLRQGVEDLRYMIQCNQYLPFVRKGTITINGDRTFKRGLFVRHVKTNEVFYIDGVQNNWLINKTDTQRKTVLTVSRGMVEPYIRGVPAANGIDMLSYFSIINTDLPDKDELIRNTDFLRNWKVNPVVFNFFMKRNQWKNVKNTSKGGDNAS